MIPNTRYWGCMGCVCGGAGWVWRGGWGSKQANSRGSKQSSNDHHWPTTKELEPRRNGRDRSWWRKVGVKNTQGKDPVTALSRVLLSQYWNVWPNSPLLIGLIGWSPDKVHENFSPSTGLTGRRPDKGSRTLQLQFNGGRFEACTGSLCIFPASYLH